MESTKIPTKEIGQKILDAIEEADAREDHRIICPVCGNEIKMTRLGETCWEYICQTEGCIHERAYNTLHRTLIRCFLAEQ